MDASAENEHISRYPFHCGELGLSGRDCAFSMQLSLMLQ